MADFKLSHRDWQQSLHYSHDEENNAMRVNMIASDGLVDAVKEGLKDLKVEVNSTPISDEKPIQVIEVPVIVVETKIEKIEIPVIVTETKIEKIEVPVIIKEIQIQEVEKIVYVPEVKLVEVPVVIEKVIKVEDNKKLNLILIIQTILIGLLVYGLLK